MNDEEFNAAVLGCCRCCYDRSCLYSLAVCDDVDPPRDCTECGAPCRNTGCSHIKSYPSPITALESVFEFVRNAGRPDTYIDWRVDQRDGIYGYRPGPDSKVEVWMVGYERTVDPSMMAGRTILRHGGGTYKKVEPTVITFEFDNYAAAEAAGGLINSALRELGTLRGLFTTMNPDECARSPEGHRVRLERFSRHLHARAVCEWCMTVLKDDVDPQEYAAIEAASGVTLARLIEREVNEPVQRARRIAARRARLRTDYGRTQP